MRMRLKDLICHSGTQSVSHWVIRMDITSISMSLFLCLYLCSYTFTAPTLHQLLHSQSLQHTHLLLLFLSFFVSVLSQSQVSDLGSIQNTNIICIKNITRLSRIARKWIYTDLDVESDLFLIFCFLRFTLILIPITFLLYPPTHHHQKYPDLAGDFSG